MKVEIKPLVKKTILLVVSLIASVFIFALFFIPIVNTTLGNSDDKVSKILCDKSIVLLLNNGTCYKDLTMGVVGRPYLKSELFEIEVDSNNNQLSNCECFAKNSKKIVSSSEFSTGAKLNLDQASTGKISYETIVAYYCADEHAEYTCGDV